MIQDIDAQVLNKNIAALLKEGENAFTRELTQRVSVLQRERLSDTTNLLKSMVSILMKFLDVMHILQVKYTYSLSTLTVKFQ